MLIECHRLFFARVKIRDFQHPLTCFATLTVFYHLISSKIISPSARAALLFLSSFSESSHGFHRALELLCDAVLLLGDGVCELVWDDRSLVGMELASQNTTHDSLLCRWMDTLHWETGGTGLATRQFATDTQAYGTQLSRRTVGMWLSWMNCVRLQRLSAAYKELLTHTCAPLVCTPGFTQAQNCCVSECLNLLCVLS